MSGGFPSVMATPTAWTEVPRGVVTSIVIQNQGYNDVFWAVNPTAPTTLSDDGMMLVRGTIQTLSDFPSSSHKVWVRSYGGNSKVVYWV
jgi:hypothetical protein